MKYREVAGKLAALGCHHWGKDLKLGTVRAIVRQLGLLWEEFLAA